MLLGEGIKQILRHVSFFPFCLTPNDNLLTQSLSMSYISSSRTCQQTRKWPKLYRLWIRLSSRPCRYRDQDQHWMESIEYNDSSFQLKPARNTPAPKNASQSALPAFSNNNSLVRTQQRPDTPMSKLMLPNSFMREETWIRKLPCTAKACRLQLGGLRDDLFSTFPIESQHSVTWAAGYCKYSV